MFESDDWDLDQDFLNDVDSRSSNVHSTTDNDEIEPKRRKIEDSNVPSLSSNNTVDRCERKSIVETVSRENDKMSRKNLILGMFTKKVLNNDISQKIPENDRVINSRSCSTRSCDGNRLPGRNVVLEISKRKNVEGKILENDKKNLDSQRNELKCEGNGGDNRTRQQSNSNNDIVQRSPSENLKKQLLEMKNKSKFKMLRTQPNKRMALIRRFPGPAGLLPDDIDANVPISYLSNLDESDNTKESNDTDLPEYCSQNTNNLFTEGAWQSMLDDLPYGSLKGSEIATVKQTASANGHSCSKIDLLAGIIERIDHSHDNPPIVLKDFTDSIRGIVHRDIPLKYPGLLESNVVILLRDVGLLKSSGSFTSDKYHILVSPSSLVAIYSNKGKKIVCTSSVGSKRNQKQTEEDEVFSRVVAKQLQNIMVHGSNKSSTESNAFENESINTDFANDFSFSASFDETTNTQSGKNVVGPTLKHPRVAEKENVEKQESFEQTIANEKKKLENEQRQKSEDSLNAVKRVFPNVGSVKKLSNNLGISETNAEKTESKMDIDDMDNNVKYARQETRKSSIRSKLMEFQNPNALTTLPRRTFESKTLSSKQQYQNTDNDTGQEKKSTKKHSEFDILCTTENDSDDEMLSQMDMDTIFGNARPVE